MTELEEEQPTMDDLSMVRERVKFLANFNRRQAKCELVWSLIIAAVEVKYTADPIARREILESLADRFVSPGNPFVLEGLVEFGTIVESIQTSNPNSLD